MDCLFCKIINKEIPAKVLYEDDIVLVIMDAFPTVDGHTLIIPKNHYNDIYELPDNVLIHVNKVAKDITTKLMNKLGETSMTWTVNYGDRQAIKHYHLHLLPNYGKSKGKGNIDKIFDILTK